MRTLSGASWAAMAMSQGVGQALRRSQASVRRLKPLRLRPWFRLPPRVFKAVWTGLLSLSLYALLFYYEVAVLKASVGEVWSFLVPLVIAFVFSFAHGAFTGAFWDAVGLKPRAKKIT
ncbi:MAG: hypothetical protein AB7E80_09110 [Hyphomicrobiaceae bacterium]